MIFKDFDLLIIHLFNYSICELLKDIFGKLYKQLLVLK